MMDLKPSFSCSLFIKSVWALLGLARKARAMVDRFVTQSTPNSSMVFMEPASRFLMIT